MSRQLRARAKIRAFRAGLELVEPGPAPIIEWCPNGISEGLTRHEVGIASAVGRVP